MDPEMTKRPTIVDIARIAGVSTASVSKAMNNRPGLSDATRARVSEVADRLGWRPSARAVALTRGGGVRAIAFHVNRNPDGLAVDPYFFDLLTGIERALVRHGFWMLLGIQEHASSDDEVEAYRTLGESQRVDGVIISDTRPGDPRFALVRELGLAAVIVSRPWSDPGLPWVGSAEPGGGMEEALAHLAALGHRRVAYVSGLEDRSHVMFRTEAFLHAATTSGLSVRGVTRTDFSPTAAGTATLALLDARERPTAIVYDNDLMALAGSQAAAGRGLQTPTDLSVIGHDDAVLGRLLRPALTTIKQDVVLLGERVALALLRELGVDIGDLPDGWDRLPDPYLVVRDSTGPTRT